jgi:hypothetical protein
LESIASATSADGDPGPTLAGDAEDAEGAEKDSFLSVASKPLSLRERARVRGRALAVTEA